MTQQQACATRRQGNGYSIVNFAMAFTVIGVAGGLDLIRPGGFEAGVSIMAWIGGGGITVCLLAWVCDYFMTREKTTPPTVPSK